MPSYSPVDAELAEHSEGFLPELEDAAELVCDGAGSTRDLEFQPRARSRRLVGPKAAISRLGLIGVALLATVLFVLGLFHQGEPTSPTRSEASAPKTAKTMQLVQSNEDPCDPLLDKQSGELLAMNPCMAPMDTLGQPASMGQIKKELGQDVAELLSVLTVSENVEATPWRVVAPGWVDVVKEKDGKAVSAEPHCSIVDGIRKGAWLKLVKDRGYIKILHKGQVWLQANKAFYSRITNGTCADNFMFPILGEEECEHAARTLELFDTSADNKTEGNGVPPGCYVTTKGKLRMVSSKPDQSYGQIAGQWRSYLREPAKQEVFEVICSSQDKAMLTCDPMHNTTTTTTMSGTTTMSMTTTPLMNLTRGPLPSLYCFSMTRAVGYEPGLVITQYAKGASIFGCDEFEVFSNGGIVSFGDFDSTEVKAKEAVMGDPSKAGVTTASFLNTLVFMKVWDMIIEDGKFWRHDWVVKVDPDAVFFPERLRQRLIKYTPTNFLDNPYIYFANCDRFPSVGMDYGKLFGSLEIFSRNALKAYAFGGKWTCETMQWQGWGEDFYMQKCMELLGVDHIGDFTLVSDTRCNYAPCSDQNRVSFHDYKNIAAYFDCWGTSLGPSGVAAYETKSKARHEQVK